MAGVALLASPALAQQSGETLTVEIDVFSGRPNPTFTIDAANLPLLYTKIGIGIWAFSPRQLSTIPPPTWDTAVSSSRVPAPPAQRRTLGGARSKGARFLKGNAPTVCQGRALASVNDVVVSDTTSELEKHVIDIALQKGHVNSSLHGIIMKTIESGGQ